jgi:hypothetical protein
MNPRPEALAARARAATVTTSPSGTSCGCGHPRSSHHREVSVCRKVSCPCANYHPVA